MLSINDAGTNGYPHGKKLKLNLYLSPYTKNNYRRKAKLNVNGKTTKFLKYTKYPQRKDLETGKTY
jgi:hypothetical protein